jgi:hypothetical protein
MFNTDAANISNYAKQSAVNTEKVLVFVQLSIQRKFSTMGNVINELNQTGNVKSLTGRQREALKVYNQKRDEIHAVIFSDLSLVDKLVFVAGLPGFGLAKAGFVLQLCLGSVGCLDTHNLKRFGIKASKFTLTKKHETNQRKAQQYINVCKNVGGSQFLWDSWCRLVADKYRQDFDSANSVSSLHEVWVKQIL